MQFAGQRGFIKLALLTLNEIYASGGRLPLYCLCITNTKIGTLRYVLAFEDMELGGNTYEACGFSVSMPDRSDSGFTDLSFGICNASGEVYKYVRALCNSVLPVSTYITLEQWHSESKELLYSLTLTMTGIQLDNTQAVFTASFADMLNTEFPKLRYTANNAPGLKYVAN